jgi:hypothetical protein
MEPPERWRRAAKDLAQSLDPARICVDQPARAELEQRLVLATAEAHAQAGHAGAALLLSGVERLRAQPANGRLLHGTGSWALSGVFRDGALTPGGDGLTGEVALTDIHQPHVFVCISTGPLSLYASATFAHANCGRSTTTLAISAERSGKRPIAEFFDALVFGDEARFTPHTAARARSLVRHRTLAMESALAAAYAQALELARIGQLAGDGREVARRLASPDDRDAALQNVLSAIVARVSADSRLMELPAEVRLAAAVEQLAPELRRRLHCPLPDDDAEERARKNAVLTALGGQFPCILTLDESGIDARADPDYPWTDERLVDEPIEVGRIVSVHAPLDQHAKLRPALRRAGASHAELLPLEDIEAMRLVAEATPG